MEHAVTIDHRVLGQFRSKGSPSLLVLVLRLSFKISLRIVRLGTECDIASRVGVKKAKFKTRKRAFVMVYAFPNFISCAPYAYNEFLVEGV